MVLRGRVDITLLTRSNLTDILRRNPQYRARVLVSERVDQFYHHRAFVRRQGPINAEELVRLLNRLRDKGQFKAIFAPYNIKLVATQE